MAAPPPVPSAGVVERELEKEYEGKPLELKKEIPEIKIDIPKERLHLPVGKKIQIDRVKIHGNASIPEHVLCKHIDGCIYKELSLVDIYDLCDRIEQYYAKQGYFLARAYPPPQDIEEGTLVIEVVEGKLGRVTVVGNKHYSERFILSYFDGLIGRPLNYDEFLRKIMLLNENSDLMAGAVFEKGKEVGTADVIVRVEDKVPAHLYLNANNYGRFLTTNFRAGGRLDVGNCLMYGDTLSVAEVVGFPIDALYFTDVTYTVPLNANGTSMEGAYLFSKYKIEELRSLRLKGESNIATLRLNQAWLRQRFLSIDFFSYFDYKQIQDFVLSERTAFDKLRVLTVGATVDHYSTPKGRDYLTLRAGAGIPSILGGLKPVDDHSSRKGGGGRFYKVNADYDRLQQLPWSSFFHFHGSGQWSPNKLTLPEQIYIGGSDTVRGFPLAVALGDSGYYLNTEFMIPPPLLANYRFFVSKKKWREVFQLVGFFDHGGVKHNGGGYRFLTGTGMGVRLKDVWGMTFSVDVGVPLDHRSLSRDVFVYIKITAQPF